jgi:hypothetical protein
MNAAVEPTADETFRLSDDTLRLRWPILVGLLVSILLHLGAVVAVLVIQSAPSSVPPEATQLVALEMVAEPPAPPPRPAPPPPPPPPPPPQPEAAPPPPPAPPVAERAPLPPPPPPQLETAAPAAESSAPRPVPRAQPAPTPPAAAPPPPRTAPPAPPPRAAESRDGLRPPVPPAPAPGVTAGRAPSGVSGPPGEKLSQSEMDHMLAQVLAVWVIDFRAARFKDIVISGNFILLPDGSLGAPFGARDPWAPEKMIANYDELVRRPDLRDQRAVLESFLGALRQAQPFRRQPGAAPTGEPKIMSFAFRLGDL